MSMLNSDRNGWIIIKNRETLTAKDIKNIFFLKIKSVLKRIYIKFYRIRNEYKAFKNARIFLKSGVYYVPSKKSEFKKIGTDRPKIRNLLHLHINFKDGQVKKPASSIEFAAGNGKAIILTQNKAIGFYFEQVAYDSAKRNFVLCYPLFNYPCVKGITFYEKQKCITMDRLNGVCYEDREHDKIIVRDLLSFSTYANMRTTPDGIVKFLQHGDAKRDNIIWNGDNYEYLDLDNINYYPPLSDVFHYLCVAGYTLNETVSMLKNNMDAVKTVCSRAKIDSDNLIDELLCGYVSHYKRTNCNFEDLRFLRCSGIKDFPKTNELLKTMGLL